MSPTKPPALQVSLYGAACSMFCLYLVRGFHGLVMVAAMYGLFLGIHLYSTKVPLLFLLLLLLVFPFLLLLLHTLQVFTYSIVRSKEFSRLWSVVQGVQAVPSLAGVALTGLLNSTGDRTGYWLPISACILAGGLLTLLPPLQPRAPNTAPRPPSQPSKKFSASNGVSMTSDSKVASSDLDYQQATNRVPEIDNWPRNQPKKTCYKISPVFDKLLNCA